MNELALFAGSGGGILGGHLLGWKTVAACEIEDYPRETLLRRQLDGLLPRFPIWDDINTFDGTQFRGSVDIISGGFPCQDISAAGKGAGIDGVRSGLWKEMHRVIGEVRPQFAFMENSPLLTSRGLGTVLGDLAEIGYDAEWVVLGADDIGAPHRRKRIWILAYTTEPGLSERSSQESRAGREANEPERLCREMAYPNVEGLQRPDVRETEHTTEKRLSPECSEITWWDSDPGEISDSKSETPLRWNGELSTDTSSGCPDRGKKSNGIRRAIEPRLGRVAHGVAHRVDRLKAIGNGQVPAVAAVAFLILHNRIMENNK